MYLKLVVVAIVLLSMTLVGCSGSGAADDDVQAARACESLYLYLQNQVPGARVLHDAQLLVTPAASGSPAPKWAGLGRDMIVATGAVFTNNTSKIKSIGKKISDQCESIPAPAKKLGGFNH